ncbi:MAG: proline--tRNA ligase [Bacilli bacterium]|nr:proline--tRNA ligase [Bacilli bacterium]
MKLKNSYFYTIRENIKDEDSISGNLLVRAGMLKKTSSGIYMFMPLGYKVLENIQKIIKEEMDNAGASELLMPALIPADVYASSNRLDAFGKDMFRLNDRFNKNYCLGPTHEELFTIAAKCKVNSYSDLPFTLYQIQTKFRDEPRPRYGLIRVREFLMKDAYSFDKDEESLDNSYAAMFNAYKKIFGRLGIDYKIVRSDVGAMGGSLSEEFQAITDIGEDTLVLCDRCDFASNMDVCECVFVDDKSNETPLEKDLVLTKDAYTREKLVECLPEAKTKEVKTLIYKTAEDKYYAVMLKEDSVVNESKLCKLLNTTSVELAEKDVVEKKLGTYIGFVGPIDLKIPVVMDNEVNNMVNFVVGANKKDYHYKNVNIGDFETAIVGDIRNVKESDVCPECGSKLIFKKGIEIGNTFKLGTKYSKALDLMYQDKDNSLKPVVMGCYGIGVGRCLASIVEQRSDDKGIIWPMNIAPYKVAIVVIDTLNTDQMDAANHLYQELTDLGIETILDDRDVRPGVKFNDMDLIGIPIRITIGKKIVDHIVEMKRRNSDEVKEVSIFDVVYNMQDIIEEENI